MYPASEPIVAEVNGQITRWSLPPHPSNSRFDSLLQEPEWLFRKTQLVHLGAITKPAPLL
jgi:hypothetical protein